MSEMEKYLKEMFDESDRVEKGLSSGGGGSGSNITYFNLVEGKNKYRIVFFPEISGKPWVRTSKHFGLMTDEGKKMVVACSMEKHGRCPLCEEAVRAVEIKEPMAWKKKSVPSYLYLALNEEGKAGVLQLPEKAFVGFNKYAREVLHDPDYGNKNIFDLQSGCYVIINFEKVEKGNSKINTYTYNKVERMHTLTSEDCQRLFKGYPKLEEINKWCEYSPEDLEKILDGDFSCIKKRKNKDEDTEFDTKKMDEESAKEKKVESKKNPKEEQEIDELDKALDL